MTLDEGPVRRVFPGPRAANVPLRVAMERKAYAELVLHAKESLDVEIGGVLVGRVCEDDDGSFLHVEAVIRGTAGREGSTHFTFTQETWNQIHKCLDEQHPDLQMVGWYHSHPGFGVEFSEMDLFIQRNFFKSPTQVAMLTDPLGGDMALCVETGAGVRYIDRFWVGGREHRARLPADRNAPAASPESAPAPGAGGSAEALRDLEIRVRQMLVAVDDQRAALHRFLVTAFLLVAMATTVFLCYGIHRVYTTPLEPPQVMNVVPVPVRCGNSTVMLGVAITSWHVPQELDSVYLQMAKEKEAAQHAADPVPSVSPVPSSAR